MLAGIQFVPKEKRREVVDDRERERESKKARKDKKAHKREKERKRDARSDSDDEGLLGADEMRRLAEAPAPASAPPLPKSSFADLLSKASASSSSSSSSSAPAAAPAPVTAAPSAPAVPAPAPSSAPAPPISSNKEMAALLRARLKAPGILPAAAPQQQQQQQQQDPGNAAAPDKRFLMAAKLAAPAQAQALSALSAAQRLRVEARLEEDMDEVYASNILRMGERYVGGELGGGGKHLARGGEDEEEGDVDVTMFTRHASAEGAQQRQQAQQEQAARRAQQAQARCDLCAGSSSHRAPLVVHAGPLASLRLLPPHLQLVPMHCEIFPCSHFPSMLQAGAAEDGLEAEVAALKACLVKCFESLGMGVVFCEAAVGFARQPHARVAVVPVPRGSEGEAQMMFREAMQDMNGHFAQHAKIIDLTAARPLSRAIPPHFPYLHAETGPASSSSSAAASSASSSSAKTGMAHVVDLEEDNDKGVTPSYLLDVVAGLLDEEPLGMRRKPGPGFREDAGATARAVGEMKRLFERHFY